MHDEDPALKTASNGAPMPPAPTPSPEVRQVVEPRESIDNPLRSNVWKFGIWPILITLINGIGWLVMYFLVLSPQVDQYRAQTKLFNAQFEKIQSSPQKQIEQLEVKEKSGRVQLDDATRRFIELQINKLEGATARLESQLANLRAQTQVTADFNSVRQGLRPNLLFEALKSTLLQNDEIQILYEIKNIGSNAAIVEAPILSLSTRPITGIITRDALMVVGKDYSADIYRLGLFQPGYSCKTAYSIKLLNQTLRGSVIFYKFQIHVSTDPMAVSTASRILGNQISDAEMKELSQFTYNVGGSIQLPK
jgi:hypothetical protein